MTRDKETCKHTWTVNISHVKKTWEPSMGRVRRDKTEIPFSFFSRMQHLTPPPFTAALTPYRIVVCPQTNVKKSRA